MRGERERRDFNVFGATDGWVCSAVETEGAGSAGLCLELLRGDDDLAVGRVGEDGWAIDWAHKNVAIGAVVDFYFRCIVQNIDPTVGQVGDGERFPEGGVCRERV